MRSLLVAVLLATGCYHFRFTHRDVPAGTPVVVYRIRVPTWVNGFVGTGEVDTRRYCADPIRTDLRVRASDVLLSIVTLLVYTPHTLYVTCPAP